jgi:hypothetical protein
MHGATAAVGHANEDLVRAEARPAGETPRRVRLLPTTPRQTQPHSGMLQLEATNHGGRIDHAQGTTGEITHRAGLSARRTLRFGAASRPIEAPVALLNSLGRPGPSRCLFAFWLFDCCPAGSLRAKATASAALRAQGSHSYPTRSLRSRRPTVRPDLALCAPMPGQISIARRQKEQAAMSTPAAHRKVQP